MVVQSPGFPLLLTVMKVPAIVSPFVPLLLAISAIAIAPPPPQAVASQQSLSCFAPPPRQAQRSRVDARNKRYLPSRPAASDSPLGTAGWRIDAAAGTSAAAATWSRRRRSRRRPLTAFPPLSATAAAASGDVTPSPSPEDESGGGASRNDSNRKTRSATSFPTCRYVSCSSTTEVAAAVRNLVKPGCRVAELGAQLREVSTSICESLLLPQAYTTDGGGGEGITGSSSAAVLVDVKRKFPRNNEPRRTKAMRRPGDEVGFYPDVATFVEVPSLEGHWREAFTTSSGGANYDVLVLDLNSIAGNDLEWSSLSIAREFAATFKGCRTAIIRSASLNVWASRLVHGQRWIDARGKAVNSDLVPPPKIVATVGVQEYRATIPWTVRPGDAVLEVGCHLGTSTARLHEAAAAVAANAAAAPTDDATQGARDTCSHCIGVDVGPKIVRGARDRYPHIYFAVGDAWRTAGLLRIQREFLRLQRATPPEAAAAAADAENSGGNIGNSSQQPRLVGFDVVYVDVGGLSGNDGLIEAINLLSSMMYALEPRCIVIKSLCVRRLASALVPAWSILQRE